MSDTTYDLFQRGRDRLRRGLPEEATGPLEQARQREPQKASIREALGIAYFRAGRYEEAESEFRAIVEIAPTEPYAHYALGRCLDKLGRPREAQGFYKLASIYEPTSDRYRARVRRR